MQVAYQVLRIISAGGFYSGESLAKQCKVTRARIWQAIELLREYGLEVHAVKGLGYSLLNEIELLDADTISSHFTQDSLFHVSQIEILNQTDSTNDYLKRSIPYLKPNHLCVAEGQVKGRGRMGRGWYSPLTKNIAMSFFCQSKLSVDNLAKLSLVVGCCVLRAIVDLIGEYPGLGLKWPNDIWYNGSKLCGILVETQQDKTSHDIKQVVIGIGLNTHKIRIPYEGKFISLEQITGTLVSRNQLVAMITNHLVSELPRFEIQGFSCVRETWDKYDLLTGHTVTVKQGTDILEGQCVGINDNGAILIKHNHMTKSYFSADVQVRPYAITS